MILYHAYFWRFIFVITYLFMAGILNGSSNTTKTIKQRCSTIQPGNSTNIEIIVASTSMSTLLSQVIINPPILVVLFIAANKNRS